MASTSTNKQPLLVDRVLHEVVDLSYRTVAFEAGVTIGGLNDAALLVDCIAGDGAVIEDIYTVSKGAAYTVNLYLSTANDYLRPQQGNFISSIASDAVEGNIEHIARMPYILAPVPAVDPQNGSGQFRAIYIPRGKALWAGAEKLTANDDGVSAPILGVQGGYF
jgi:hypothetical protein